MTAHERQQLVADVDAFCEGVRPVEERCYGGRGYFDQHRPARHWKDARVCRIYEGTDEILKLKIAANVLGKQFAAFSD